jgi:23S rRNA (cytosine1962-C5)-methyltransferase
MRQVLEEVRKRRPLATESRRLLHGRGHCFPGYEDLLIDWFSPVVLVSLYQPRPDEWLQQLLAALQSEVPEMNAVLLQERYLPHGPVRVLSGQLPAELFACEAGLRYQLRLGEAQNIGFFPDMAVGRRLVRKLAAGRNVLNLFAYTCSFSVTGLAAGAEHVTNLDMNRGALQLGKRNHELNQLDLRQVSFLPQEFFRSVGKLKRLGPFGLIICDPPAYQGKSFKAERDWPKLLRKMNDLLAPAGDLVACLNGPHLEPDFLLQLTSEICPQLNLLQALQPGDDFPEAEQKRGGWLFHFRQE